MPPIFRRLWAKIGGYRTPLFPKKNLAGKIQGYSFFVMNVLGSKSENKGCRSWTSYKTESQKPHLDGKRRDAVEKIDWFLLAGKIRIEGQVLGSSDRGKGIFNPGTILYSR